ncbi:MAG: hypothetical protein LC099_00390 [Anaerolineales bacterium]|nr:hypothetical protein [Anaerolineales bacterium]
MSDTEYLMQTLKEAGLRRTPQLACIVCSRIVDIHSKRVSQLDKEVVAASGYRQRAAVNTTGFFIENSVVLSSRASDDVNFLARCVSLK